MYTILGAGLAGLSASYHLGHPRCKIFEKNCHPGGHIFTEQRNGFTWDEGPHVSFTKHEYVRKLLALSVDHQYLDYPVFPGNYFEGNWIPHPAQSNLHAVSEPLRSKCLNDFLNSRDAAQTKKKPENYAEWLEIAFGKVFAETFPAVYTSKYWTLPAAELSTDWVGNRVFLPDIKTVKAGAEKPLSQSTHYITNVRYPKHGGFYKYSSLLLQNAPIELNKEVKAVDLKHKLIFFRDGDVHSFEKLISAIPLPLFVNYCDPPPDVKEAADNLLCSELLLINIEVSHLTKVQEHWLYVYDQDKYSTRINFTDLLSPHNSPAGMSGIQVEVYFSRVKPKIESDEFYAQNVIEELIEMKLLDGNEFVKGYHTKWIPFANVIFDHSYKSNLNRILDWLEMYGLEREDDDLLPMTNWDEKFMTKDKLGSLVLTGRFSQWKYYWTDDCILRGKFISENQ